MYLALRSGEEHEDDEARNEELFNTITRQLRVRVRVRARVWAVILSKVCYLVRVGININPSIILL